MPKTKIQVMPNKKILIFYFSGTGNAREAARWTAHEAESSGWEAQLFNIEKKPDTDKILNQYPGALIGIYGPTHGFNFPPILLKFFHSLPKGNKQNIFLLNTRAGMKLGKAFLPGLSGLAHYYAWLVLRLKGFRIIGMQPLDMPSNWISLHPALKKQVELSIVHRCEGIVRAFAQKMIQGKNSCKALWSLPLDIMLWPVAFLYFIAGRFFLAKTFISDTSCIDCRLCVKECPSGALKIINGRPFWGIHCESCMRCMNICPKRSIQTSLIGPALGLLLGFGAASILKNQVFSIEWKFAAWLQNPIVSESIGFIIDWGLSIGCVTIIYFIIHQAMGIKIIGKILRWGNFTVWKFWRRYQPGFLNK